MSADVVNLRRARKAKDRAEREAEAARNRTRFGRTKNEKKKEAAERALSSKRIDAHRRDGET
jgi:hypothetical protein